MITILHYISQVILCVSTPLLFTIIALSIVTWKKIANNDTKKAIIISTILISIIEVLSYYGVILTPLS